MPQSLSAIRETIKDASIEELEEALYLLKGDERKGALSLAQTIERRIRAEKDEADRLAGLYSFEEGLIDERDARIAVGLDEVGRGAVAGPLAVGAVVLDREMPPIKCLDDSKKLKSEVRERVSRDVKASCLASCVVYVEPEAIDEMGISNALRQAFKEAVSKIEQAGITPDVILLDGNPMHLDSREVNVVKGDSRCASIAAASVIAKVERDALMTSLDESFPGYQFAQNKGYGTSDHMCAIEQKGLSTIHRRSFLTKMEQETLF